MRIAIDLDGVTLDSISSWLKVFHPNSVPEDIKDWNAWNWVDGCDSEEQFFNEFGRQNSEDVELIEGAKSAIFSLAQEHDVFFLTSKSARAQEWTEEVLEREGLDTIPIKNSWLEGKQKDEYDYDILIDDCPHHTQYLGCVIFDQPWNRNVGTRVRVRYWSEVLQLVDNLKNSIISDDL